MVVSEYLLRLCLTQACCHSLPGGALLSSSVDASARDRASRSAPSYTLAQARSASEVQALKPVTATPFAPSPSTPPAVGVEADPRTTVRNAAVYRAYTVSQDEIATFKNNLDMGQLSTLPLHEVQAVPFDLTYQDVRLIFVATVIAVRLEPLASALEAQLRQHGRTLQSEG